MQWPLERQPPAYGEPPSTKSGFLPPARRNACRLAQAVPLTARRNPGSHKGTVEGPAPLLQLPHLDGEVVKRLQRKRVRGLPDLQALSGPERRDVLAFAGLPEEQVGIIGFCPDGL